MRKILISLMIIQKVDNMKRLEQKLPKLGRGFMDAYRLNPFNPLSYIFIPLALIAGLLMFGVVGFWKEVDLNNPFKWN